MPAPTRAERSDLNSQLRNVTDGFPALGNLREQGVIQRSHGHELRRKKAAYA